MRKYLAITKGIIMENSVFRAHFVITMAGNLVYLIIVYFLWKAIFASSPQASINGMTFTNTFIYLTFASTIFNLLQSWTDWDMSRSIIDGRIIMNFIRPMDYQLYQFFNTFGSIVTNFFLIFLPTFIVISIVVGGAIHFGLNMLVFFLALILAMFINFIFDFFIGTLSFYTESNWGIIMTKEVIILLFSGAVIPLPFFPEGLRHVMEFLPFQAVYNLPLQILINTDYGISDFARVLGIQAFWFIVLFALSRVFFRQASKVITINGG